MRDLNDRINLLEKEVREHRFNLIGLYNILQKSNLKINIYELDFKNQVQIDKLIVGKNYRYRELTEIFDKDFFHYLIIHWIIDQLVDNKILSYTNGWYKRLT